MALIQDNWKKINQQREIKIGNEYVFVFLTGSISEEKLASFQRNIIEGLSEYLSIKDMKFNAPNELIVQGIARKNPIPIAVVVTLLLATAFAISIKLTLKELYLVTESTSGSLILLGALGLGGYLLIKSKG